MDTEDLAKVIGVCSPGPLNKEEGMILDAPNLPDWKHKPFMKLIEEATGKVAYLTNDANAAAMAQSIDSQDEMLVFITVSTGVGGGIVYKGKLIEGKRIYAGEIGMMIISDEDRKHSKLYSGSLESLCSGTALALKASQVYGEDMSTKELFCRYQDRELKAVEIVEQWVEYFSRGIANLLQIIEPDSFFIGGSVILNNPWLLDLVEQATRPKVYDGLKDHIVLKVAKYGDDAGLIGAALNGYVNYKEIEDD